MTALTIKELATLRLMAGHYELTLVEHPADYLTTSRKMKGSRAKGYFDTHTLADLESIVALDRDAKPFEMGAGLINWLFSGNWGIFPMVVLNVPMADGLLYRFYDVTKKYLDTIDEGTVSTTSGFTDPHGQYQHYPSQQEIAHLWHVLCFLEDAVTGTMHTVPTVELNHLIRERNAGRVSLLPVRARTYMNNDRVPVMRTDYHADAVSTDDNVRLTTARDMNCPVDVLVSLHTDKEWRVRGAVATHPNTSFDVLIALATDPFSEVRAGIAYNPHSEDWLLYDMILDGDHNIVLGNIATNPTASEETLALLARNPSSLVRTRVAGHPNTSRETLAVLASDSNVAVKRIASHSLDAIESVATDHETYSFTPAEVELAHCLINAPIAKNADSLMECEIPMGALLSALDS